MPEFGECIAKLDELKTKLRQVRAGDASADELRLLYNEIAGQKADYRSAGVSMRSYTKIVGDAGVAVEYIEAGSRKNGTGKRRHAKYENWIAAAGSAGLLILGTVAAIRHYSSEPAGIPIPEALAAEYGLSFAIKNGKSRLDIDGTIGPSDFTLKMGPLKRRASLRLDTQENELSFSTEDANDPNAAKFSFEGGPNSAHAVFSGTEEGKYRATVKKGPNSAPE